MFILNKKSVDYSISERELFELADRLSLPIIYVFTPVNLEKEKRKFFNSDTYNPKFVYKQVKNDNDKILDELMKVTEVNDVDPKVSKFYLKYIQSKIEVNNLIKSVGNNEKVTEISIHRFGLPSTALYNNSAIEIRHLLRNKKLPYKLVSTEIKSNVVTSDVIIKVINDVFKELGLDDWQVFVSKRASNQSAKIALKKKAIYIAPTFSRTPLMLKKLIVHEIFTHVFRHINGLESGVLALSKANLPKYQDVEEGLATFNEEKYGVLQLNHLLKKMVGVLALYNGVNMSFREVYNFMHLFFAKNVAFNLTYRVKRGLADTSKPGIFAKDVIYWRGFRMVRRKIFEEPNVYNMLYAGKISFAQLKWVEEGIIKRPRLIPDIKVLDKVFEKHNLQ